MRRLSVFLSATSFLLASPVSAAERGVIEGRVVNAITGKPQSGVRVQLFGLTQDRNERVSRTATTGRDGTYEFDNLTTGSEWAYVLDAHHDGGLFPGRPVTIPDNTSQQPVIETVLRVWDTTTDPATVLVRRDDLFAVVNEATVSVIESVTVVNQGDRAYVGRGAKRAAGTSSTLGFPLPEAADRNTVRVVDATMDVPQIMRTSFGFAITVAIPPGESRFTYSYQVAGNAGTFDLSRTMLYPTIEMSTFVEDPLEVDSPRLSPNGDVDLDGRSYRRWTSTEGFDAGDLVQVSATAKGAPPWPLFAAVGVGLMVLIGLVAVVRRKKRLAEPVAPDDRPSSDRDDLVAEIAALDLHFDAGGLSKEEWAARRAELKERLQQMSAVG